MPSLTKTIRGVFSGANKKDASNNTQSKVPTIYLSELHDPKEIGSGNYGVVHKAEYLGSTDAIRKLTSANQIVIKTLKPHSSEDENGQIAAKEFLQEGKIISALSNKTSNNSKYVVKGGQFNLDSPKEQRIFSQFAQHGDLQSLLQTANLYLTENAKIPPPTAAIAALVNDPDISTAQLFNSMHKGLQHLTDVKVLHNDIATRNFLVPSLDIKNGQALNLTTLINDFGKSQFGTSYQSDGKGQFPLKWLNDNVLKNLEFNTSSDLYALKVSMIEAIGKLNNKDFVLDLPRPIFQDANGQLVQESYISAKQRLGDTHTLINLLLNVQAQINSNGNTSEQFKQKMNSLITSYSTYFTTLPDPNLNSMQIIEQDKQLLIEANRQLAKNCIKELVPALQAAQGDLYQQSISAARLSNLEYGSSSKLDKTAAQISSQFKDAYVLSGQNHDHQEYDQQNNFIPPVQNNQTDNYGSINNIPSNSEGIQNLASEMQTNSNLSQHTSYSSMGAIQNQELDLDLSNENRIDIDTTASSNVDSEPVANPTNENLERASVSASLNGRRAMQSIRENSATVVEEQNEELQHSNNYSAL